jgi:hypothetical protein
MNGGSPVTGASISVSDAYGWLNPFEREPTMSQANIPNDLVLTEDQFREVIERATRADLRDAGITVDTLRQVAAELNIDPAQIERALLVVIAPPEVERVAAPVVSGAGSWGRRLNDILPRRNRATVFALLAGSLGWFSAHIGNVVNTGAMAFVDVPVGIALILLMIANSIGRRADGRFDRFMVESAAMWGASTVLWSLTHGTFTSDSITWLLTCIGASAGWGWVFVRPKRPGAPGSPDALGTVLYAIALEPLLRSLTSLRMSANTPDAVTGAPAPGPVMTNG